MCNTTTIWNSLMADKSFCESIPEGPMRSLYREMVEATPATLGALLDQNVSLLTLAQSRAAVAKYITDSELVPKCGAAMMKVERLTPADHAYGQAAALKLQQQCEKAAIDASMFTPDLIAQGAMTEELAPAHAAYERLKLRLPLPESYNIRQLVENYPEPFYNLVG